MPPNFERKARRKAQTKLTFDPVVKEESSSPAVKMSPARVRYQLPTPAKSSQTMGAGTSAPEGLDEDDDDLVVFSQRRSRSRLQIASSDEEEDYTTPLKRTKKVIKVPGAFRSLLEKPLKQKHISLSDSDDEEDELARVTPTAKQHTRVKIGDSEDEDLQDNTPKRKRAVLAVSDEEDDEDELPIPISARRRSRPTIALSDDEDGDAPLRPKAQRSTVIGTGIGLRRQFIELSDDDDDVIISSPSKRRRSLALTDHYGNNDLPDISPPKRVKVDDDSDSVISPAKRPRRGPAEEEEAEDSESESENDIPLRGRSRTGNPEPSSSKSPITPSRYTRQAKPPKKHRTAKQKAAELLRRKRTGEKIDELTESSDSDGSVHGLYDSDPELQVLDYFEDEEPETETAGEAAESAPRRRARNSGEGDDEDEGFIVDDDENNNLGIPELPLQFSRRAHKPLKENFADCVEWLVHNRIDPDFPDRTEERYRHAFNKVDDEAQGYATSAFISSQWTAEFTAAIRHRPLLTVRFVEDGEGFTEEGVMRCDACNHRNHPTKYALSFRGEPYNRKTLEDVEQDSDYEMDDEDAIPVDEAGNDLEPAGREWFSGRDCSDNAFQAHKLVHWRYSLNQAVIEMLAEGRHLTPRKIAKREAWSVDERWVYADAIVQAWQADGAVTSLYREFKTMMDTARTFEPRRYAR